MSVASTWAALVLSMVLCGGVFGYTRPPPRKTLFIPASDDNSPTTPDQVHVSMVGNDRMRVTWLTQEDVPTIVHYGTSQGIYNLNSSNGYTTTYNYMLYKSPRIHHVITGPLQPNTVYYYTCGSDESRNFSFKTPPSQLPIKFAVAGDLGQTEDTQSTLDHIEKSNYDVLLLPGDLSYADTIQEDWDSFGRLVQHLASQRPWMVTQGNHEVEKIPILHSTPFTSYNSRWRMPYDESGSSSKSNLYYSFDVAGAVHVIMLGSYDDFDSDSEQYKWLQSDLARVDRGRTPWVVVLVHAPWYSSNEAHRGEFESVGMKASMEGLLYGARVDLVFAGHVHAYERFGRVYDGNADKCGPVYITIGDGGNREGLASMYIEPQPAISVFREASFGHGTLNVLNMTHAYWSWNKNEEEEGVVSDSVWLTTLAATPGC